MSNKKTYRLFSPDGCVSRDGLLGIARKTLSEENELQVWEHIRQCEFCRDAMDGIRSVKNFDTLEGEIHSLENELNANFEKEISTQRGKIISLKGHITWVGAAASVIILIGLLYFLTDKINFKTDQTTQDINTDVLKVPPMPETENKVWSNPEKQLESNSQTIDKSAEISKNNQSGVEESRARQKTKPPKIQPTSGNSDDKERLEQLFVIENDSEQLNSESTDIASTQPVEYYLGSVEIFEQQFEGVYLDEAVIQDKANYQPNDNYSKDAELRIQSSDSINIDQNSTLQKRSENEHFFTVVDQMPQFPGGTEALQKYLSKNIQYPSKAIHKNIQGTVVLSFIVEKDGEISSTRVIRSIGGGCDEEAVRVIESMPAWNPAIKNGEPLRAIFNLPVRFRLR